MIGKPYDAAIVRSTFEVGHDMGLKVVAEGVEIAGVLTALAGMGCNLARDT